MIIEFVGLPGSGKTTLYDKVLDKLAPYANVLSSTAVRERCVRGQPGLPWAKLTAHLNTLTTFRMIYLSGLLHIWRGYRPLADKIAATKRFAVTLDNYAYLHRQGSSSEWVIFDEGIAQRAFMVMVDAEKAIPRHAIQQYALAMPKPDVLIYLAMPPRVAAERVRERPRGITKRLRGLSSDRLTGVMQEAQEMLDALVTCLEVASENAITVVRLDANDLDLAAIELDHWLDEHLLNPGVILPDRFPQAVERCGG
ncbi:MAG: AAA family ATPase [Caldilineaceae bacterium]|nr:AAA family ATPase [Caldilineaceae bacterium]